MIGQWQVLLSHSRGYSDTCPSRWQVLPPPPNTLPSRQNATASRRRPAKTVPTGGVGSAKHQSPAAGVCSARFAMTPHGEKRGKTRKRNKDEKATKKNVRPYFGDPRRGEKRKPQTRDGQWLAYQNTSGTPLIHTWALKKKKSSSTWEINLNTF